MINRVIKKFKYQRLVWLDLENPSEKELKDVSREFNLHPLVLEELTQPSRRSKVDVYSDSIYMVLHFPHEIDFILGKKFLITAHYQSIDVLNDLGKIFESGAILARNAEPEHSGFIFFNILRELYRAVENELSFINEKLHQVEQELFVGRERSTIKNLYDASHLLSRFRWSLKTHQPILNSLELCGTELYGKKFQYYLRALRGEYAKSWSMTESNQSTFNELRQTTESLISIKTNETMKRLTTIAFIFLPLSIVAQVFGMTVDLPLGKQPADFYFLLGFMILATIFSFFWAKKQKWI